MRPLTRDDDVKGRCQLVLPDVPLEYASDADNFKYGWQRLCDPATAGQYAFTGYIVAGCEDWNSMDPKKDDPAIVKGIAWLKANQRESGRWFTQSLNTDRAHYISHAGTAFALMAIKEAN